MASVPTLARFVEESFPGWRGVNLNDLSRLVVDGDSVCAHLYLEQLQRQRPGTRLLPGVDYPSLHSAVKEFFSELLFTGVKVLVILSGSVSTDPEPGDGMGSAPKLESFRSLSTQSNKAAMLAQSRLSWQQDLGSEVVPVMVTRVFADALRRLDLKFRVSETNGKLMKREVAAYANHFKCPVLAADSDFFLFEIEAGYMPVEKLSTVIANGLLYTTRDFQSHFCLKDPKLQLALPLMHGNSSVKGLRADSDFESTLKEASGHDSFEDYIAGKVDEDLCKNLAQFYCNPQLPDDRDPEDYALSGPLDSLPEWVVRKFREGYLESQLLLVPLRNSFALSTVTEDIRKDSAWLTSRPIRQCLYALMGVSGETRVRETIRARSSPEVTDSYVSPTTLDPPVSFRELADKGKQALADLVLGVLDFHRLSREDIRREFEILGDQWKLPVAATFYWYRACDNPPAHKHLVKALLLSFLACSGELDSNLSVTSTPFEPVTRESKPDHLTALHAFAQWQCVYHDALTLNCLAREPFFTTSPAYLYSGKVAMHYASFARKNRSVDGVIGRGAKGWDLYNRFLYLVTGCDVEGRRGVHAKHQPKPRTPVSVKEAPSLQETNRYALLSDTEQV